MRSVHSLFAAASAPLGARIESEPHSPDEFRVNATVRNQPAFDETSGVKPGDAMYLRPDQRVSIL